MEKVDDLGAMLVPTEVQDLVKDRELYKIKVFDRDAIVCFVKLKNETVVSGRPVILKEEQSERVAQMLATQNALADVQILASMQEQLK